jgi:hypothetical protein
VAGAYFEMDTPSSVPDDSSLPRAYARLAHRAGLSEQYAPQRLTLGSSTLLNDLAAALPLAELARIGR